MRLSLEKPRMKKWTLFAYDLSEAGDDNLELDERGRFDHLARTEAQRLGIFVFHQMEWEGTSGWEYWTDNQDKILEHAQAVAALLEVGLSV